MSPNLDSRSLIAISERRLAVASDEIRRVALDLGSDFSELINCVGIIGATRMRLRAMDSKARVWSAMVGPDGFGVVQEKTALPEVSASFDCDASGAVHEVAR